MKYDDFLRNIGEFGPYQKRICLFVLVPLVTLTVDTTNVIFALATPEHRCSVAGLPNDTFRSQGLWHDALVNESMPYEDGAPSQCFHFTNDSSDTADRNKSLSKCTSWVFDHSVYEVTGGEEFLLVCDRAYVRSVSISVSYSGALATFFTGVLSDIIGRRRCFFIAVLLCAVTGLGQAFSESVECYTVFRFVSSMSMIWLYLTGFVICMELSGSSKRNILGIAVHFAWCFGLLILGGLAYGMRNWRYTQLWPAVGDCLYLGMWWFIPESPRWLLVKGRYEEAKVILEKTARVNGKEMPKSDLIEINDNAPKEKLSRLFTSRTMLIRTLIIYFNWFMVSMEYYALSYNISNLSGDVYLNFTIGNLAELLGLAVTFFLLYKMGRKPLVATSMIVGGAACILTAFPKLYLDKSMVWVTTALAMVGRFAICCAFAVIYIYSAEVFPTVVRQSAVSASSLCGRVGAIVAPYIADMRVKLQAVLAVAVFLRTLQDIMSCDSSLEEVLFGKGKLNSTLPLIVIGMTSLAAGIMSLWLPETRGVKLPDTIQDAIDIDRKKLHVAMNDGIVPTAVEESESNV